jgi:hypothetical protein
MDLEQLTKHQIVLLTLLVSFMTSIATGIVTVSLMNQAPPEVTRTINQIVQQTVEKVVPVSQGAAVANTVEKTVVIKNDDLAAQSIASVQKGIIRIVAKGDDKLIARGIIITAQGKALSDREALEASSATAFEAILASGKRVPAVFHASTGSSTLAVLDLLVGTSTGFAPVSLADASAVTLGESVIRIGGVGNDSVGMGVIATLPTGDNTKMVEATVSSVTPGSVLVSLFGDIIGISTGASQSQGSDFYTLPKVTNTSVGTTTPATKPAS